MFHSFNLTEDEKKWNSYRGEGGKPPVLLRVYPYQAVITSANPSASIPHFASRRARINKITWSGDVNTVRVNIYTSVGEKLTVNPAHVPLLSGHTCHSNYSRSALITAYPSALVGAPTAGPKRPPAWDFDLEPNLVIPGNVTLFFDYSLEDRSTAGDPVLAAGGTFRINHVIFSYEFPGFEGGAL